MSSGEKILLEIQALSSNTLATLSGQREYDAIDRLRTRFWQTACSALACDSTAYSSWVEAWAWFVASQANLALAIAEGRGVGSVALDVRAMPDKSIQNVLELLQKSGECLESSPVVQGLQKFLALADDMVTTPCDQPPSAAAQTS